MKYFRIEFLDTRHPPLELLSGTCLSEHLTLTNSPILFGCRTGQCGTCLVELAVLDTIPGSVAPPDEYEVETLDVYAPGNRLARLACQVSLTANIRLRKIESE